MQKDLEVEKNRIATLIKISSAKMRQSLQPIQLEGETPV